MTFKNVIIAHSWTDVSINMQTKSVALALSKSLKVTFLSQARLNNTPVDVSQNLDVIEWPHKRPNKFNDFIFLLRLLRKEKPDLIIAHFGATNICMLGAWLMNVKYRVCWMHTLSYQYFLESTSGIKYRINLLFRSIAYSMATHVIVLNEYARKDAINMFNVNPVKIHKIYNGLKSIDDCCQNVCHHKVIRYIGRLDESKGVDILIRAFSAAYRCDNRMKLEIAGKGSAEGDLMKLVVQAGLESVVQFRGFFRNYHDALSFIGGAYLLAVPSRIDNFPTVILEAFARGIPVIASDVGGIPDMIEHGKEGLLFKSEDVKEMCEAMKLLCGNIDLRNVMSSQAKASFENKFTLEKHIASVMKFIENINQHP